MPTNDTQTDGIEKLRKLHSVLAEDSVYEKAVPKDFNEFVKKYSDPTKLSKLHSVLIADEVYAKAVPADINEAATKYGLGKPSVNPPSASGLTSQQNGGAMPPAQVNPSEELPSSDGRSTLPEQPQNPDFGFQGVVDVVGKETPISVRNKMNSRIEGITGVPQNSPDGLVYREAQKAVEETPNKPSLYLTPEELEYQKQLRSEETLSDKVSDTAVSKNIPSAKVMAETTPEKMAEGRLRIIQRDLERKKFEEKAKKGNFLGMLQNSLMEGYTSTVNNTADFTLYLLSLGGIGVSPEYDAATNQEKATMFSQALDDVKIKKTLDKYLKTTSTTDEYIQKATQEGGAIVEGVVGLAGSAFPMMTPSQSGFFINGFVDAKKEIQEEMPNLSPWKQTAYAFTQGAVQVALERAGLSNLAKNKSVTRALSGKVMDAMKTTLGKFSAKEADAFATKVVNGFAAEAETGATQYAVEEGIKQLTDALEGSDDKFEFEGSEAFLSNMMKAGLSEGVGGAVMKTVAEIPNLIKSPSKRKEAQEKTTQSEQLANDFENPNVSIEAKKAIGSQIDSNSEYVAKSYAEDLAKYESLPQESKDELNALHEDILSHEAVINDPNVSPETKALSEKMIQELEAKGESILDSAPKPKELSPLENSIQEWNAMGDNWKKSDSAASVLRDIKQQAKAQGIEVKLSGNSASGVNIEIVKTADESLKVETPTEATTINQPNTTSNEGQNGNRSEANGSQESAAEAENGNGKENASQNEEVSQGAEQAPNLPTKVFHATTATFEGLPKKGVEAKTAAFNEPSGVYYSTSEEGAKQATGKTEGQRIVEAEFTPKNPLVIEDALTDETYNAAYEAAQNQVREELGDEEYQIREEAEDVELGQKVSEAFSKILIDQGYDSVVNKGNGDVIVLDESVVAEPARKINSVNPTGSIFADYTPQQRMAAPLGENMVTLDKTIGGSPDDVITIYRGGKGDEIVGGDYVTTNKRLAQDYAGNGNVLELQVLKKDVIDDKTEGGGEEYIYRPQSKNVVEEKPAKKELTPEQVKRQDLRALMEDIADWNGMGKVWKRSNASSDRFKELNARAKENGLTLSRTMTGRGASIKATDAKGNEVKLAAIKKLADEGKAFWSNDKYSAQEGDGKLEFYDNNGDQIDARSKEYGEAYNAYVKANAKAFSGKNDAIDVEYFYDGSTDQATATEKYVDRVIDNGNAFEIASNFNLIKEADDNNATEDKINPDWQLARAIGNISESDFNRFIDRNYLHKGSTWVKKNEGGLTLEQRVKELLTLPEMAQAIGELDEQGVINKISEIVKAYPNGANSVPKGATTDYVKRAQENFKEITGIELNDRTAAEFTALSDELGKGNLDAEAYWDNLTEQQKQELTDEQDRIFSEGKRGDIATKEIPSELAKVKGISGDVSAKAKEIIAAMDAVYDSKGQNFKARKTKLETTYGDEAKKAIDINRNFGKYYEAMRKLGAIIDKEC